MDLNRQLEAAIATAGMAHSGQVDKQGLPYILHPIHLMNQVLPDKEAAIVALLHDVVEDSNYTMTNLNDVVEDSNYTMTNLYDANFSYSVLVAVNLLTKKPGDSYEVYIRKISANPLARKVKLADLRHNSDITRLKGVRQKDMDRLAKYHAAYLILQAAENG